jgi:hypothetical protein
MEQDYAIHSLFAIPNSAQANTTFIAQSYKGSEEKKEEKLQDF